MNKKIWFGIVIVVALLLGMYKVFDYLRDIELNEDALYGDTSLMGKEDGETSNTEDSGDDVKPLEQSTPDTTNDAMDAPQPLAAKIAGYTITDVSSHQTKESCWSAINGNVYDLTNWIGRHPGGEAAIEQICGKDGSALFNGQHEGGATQASILLTYKIGVLAK